MKEAVVLGLGVSGRGVARLLMSRGHAVYGIDDNIDSSHQAQDLGITVVSDLAAISLTNTPLIVASPGIDPTSELYQSTLQLGPIIGEAEYCLQGAEQPVIGITGTNGKTTVTKMVEHILLAAGKKGRAVGNVGLSFGDYFVNPDSSEILVAELSSYQTETLHSNVIDVGILLNLTSDHLDRHHTMDQYFQAKWQLHACLKTGGHFFVHASVSHPIDTALVYGLHGRQLYWTRDGKRYEETIENILPMRYRQLPWHEQENAVGAWLIVQTFGVMVAQCRQALETFEKPPHRLEFVTTLDEVHYFNDSKGTNIDAVIKAVQAMEGLVTLIAGGVDKGSSFHSWKEAFKGRVIQVFAIGEAAIKIQRDLHGSVDVTCVRTLEEAVKLASKVAPKHSQVLFSPGCSSFDMFRNYAQRGDAFKEIVNSLKHGP